MHLDPCCILILVESYPQYILILVATDEDATDKDATDEDARDEDATERMQRMRMQQIKIPFYHQGQCGAAGVCVLVPQLHHDQLPAWCHGGNLPYRCSLSFHAKILILLKTLLRTHSITPKECQGLSDLSKKSPDQYVVNSELWNCRFDAKFWRCLFVCLLW